MILLALLIGALPLLIMDVNRPQRGVIEVGVAPLERAQNSISAPMRWSDSTHGERRGSNKIGLMSGS